MTGITLTIGFVAAVCVFKLGRWYGRGDTESANQTALAASYECGVAHGLRQRWERGRLWRVLQEEVRREAEVN
jgi:hypothetical protein